MTSRVLHPLTCTKCGASLPAADGQRILVCPFCQQSHAFVPPPLEPGPGAAPPAASAKLPLIIVIFAATVVMSALVSFGVLRSAPTTPNPAPATKAAAPAVATTLGPGDPKAVYAKGQAVDIHWGSSWWPGSVVDVNGTSYRAHYEGYGAGSDEWVTADRLRPHVKDDAPAPAAAAPEADAGDPNATYAVGDPVDIRWGSSWWAGSVKKKDGKRYRIGYDGYGASSDEWVTAIRLRPRAKP